MLILLDTHSTDRLAEVGIIVAPVRVPLHRHSEVEAVNEGTVVDRARPILAVFLRSVSADVARCP